ncbi:S9 family peptidase [Sphingomonas sp.]|uniref:S9 family peptidase n=1 Tax=Sphingomonas sp. TaxID=28214 RepID=UPI002BE98361|nr:S9 family peptidase [Sphingomonas sp.]HWK36384.1 S9 family peptidase [Sphingomonas sp.]
MGKNANGIGALMWGVAGLAMALATPATAQNQPPVRAESVPAAGAGDRFVSADLFHLRFAADPQIAPDGRRALFTVQYADRIGAPYTRLWSLDLATGKSAPWGSAEGIEGGGPLWSPDGGKVLYRGADGLMIANPDGSGARKLADLDDTNHPLPRMGARYVWSPDGSRVAFVSATPSTEPEMEADPIVITRYWYRPARGWPARFNDNKHLHLFVADVASGQVTQLTDGQYYEHSPDWSPDGRTLLFVSNHEADPDLTYNADIFTLDLATKAIRQITHTRGIESAPTWSPDGRTILYSGLKRQVTSSESNMEEPHAWTLDVASGQAREIGAGVDSTQGRPVWSPDGKSVYFTVQARGSVALYRLPATGGAAERIGPAPEARGSVSGFSVARNGTIVAAMATPGDLAQLYVFRGGRGAPTQVTSLNTGVLGRKALAPVEAFTFKTFDDRDVEAFLTVPAGFDASARGKYPLIVVIHGGPHGQQGPAFSAKNQALAAAGYASLMVNYRGSTGYGQSFANLIARDQDGGEGRDVLAGLDAALAKYPALDEKRLGIEGASYGGQLTNWLITQDQRFKAAIPWAGISNLVSHNYMSVYHDYLQQEYFGKPHEDGINDMLWGRSAIRFVHKVKTPVLLSHGDNDLLVNPAEDEQYFTALKDVGVEAVMLRYPREGHSMRETQHVADFLDRSLDWYAKHFAAVK